MERAGMLTATDTIIIAIAIVAMTYVYVLIAILVQAESSISLLFFHSHRPPLYGRLGCGGWWMACRHRPSPWGPIGAGGWRIRNPLRGGWLHGPPRCYGIGPISCNLRAHTNETRCFVIGFYSRSSMFWKVPAVSVGQHRNSKSGNAGGILIFRV